MKGAIQPDHMGVHRYELLVLGFPSLTFTEISGIESETTAVDLPDRTTASGGEEVPTEFTGMMPMHHSVEQGLMEAWLQEGRDPVSPLYKKAGTLIFKSISQENLRVYELIGLWVSKRGTPDAEMANDGEMAQVEWTFKADSVKLIA